MECIQGWPSKGPEGLGPKSLLTFKIHIFEPWIAISRHFPKANFILGHPVSPNLIQRFQNKPHSILEEIKHIAMSVDFVAHYQFAQQKVEASSNSHETSWTNSMQK